MGRCVEMDEGVLDIADPGDSVGSDQSLNWGTDFTRIHPVFAFCPAEN
jgi:hypothetical protein